MMSDEEETLVAMLEDLAANYNFKTNLKVKLEGQLDKFICLDIFPEEKQATIYIEWCDNTTEVLSVIDTLY